MRYKLILILTFFLLSITPTSISNAATCEDDENSDAYCDIDISVQFRKVGDTEYQKRPPFEGIGPGDEFEIEVEITNDGAVDLVDVMYSIKNEDEIDRISGDISGDFEEIPSCDVDGDEDVDCDEDFTIRYRVSEDVEDGECTDLVGEVEATIIETSTEISEENIYEVCFSVDEDSEDENNDDDDDNNEAGTTTGGTTTNGEITEVPDTGSEQTLYLMLSSLLFSAGLGLAYKKYTTIKYNKLNIVKNIAND